MDRDRAKDLIPDWVTGRLEPAEASAVEVWLEEDEELKAEAALLRSLAAARPRAPADLARRVAAAVEADRRQKAPSGKAFRFPPRIPVWGWAAAAALAFLAFGTEFLVQIPTDPEADPLVVAVGEAPTPWGESDVLVAGAPVLSGLSDEALESLLQELEG